MAAITVSAEGKSIIEDISWFFTQVIHVWYGMAAWYFMTKWLSCLKCSMVAFGVAWLAW
jgi:hypothetical protein